jgi:hypothetical protein
MKPKTEVIWLERIEEWGRSGPSATEFAENKPAAHEWDVDVGGVAVLQMGSGAAGQGEVRRDRLRFGAGTALSSQKQSTYTYVYAS